MKIQYIQPQTTIGEVCTLGNLMSVSLPYNPDAPSIDTRAPKAKTV